MNIRERLELFLFKSLSEYLIQMKADLLLAIEGKGNQIMGNVSQGVADLQQRYQQLADKVAAETTVELSAEVLLQGMFTEIKALRDQLANANLNDPAAIAELVAGADALLTTIQNNTDTLKASVVQNTEADPNAPLPAAPGSEA